MRKLFVVLVCFLFLMLFSQMALATQETDTTTFITANFDLQEQYNRVLCVSGSNSCPAQITTAVPCLLEGCANTPLNYNVHSPTFNTIQAASNAAVPGDLIIIMPGTYAGVSVEEKHGANNAYIHFLGWGEPGSVIVNAPSSGGIRHHFYFIDTDYYIIQNIAFANSSQGAGIFFSGYFNATGHFSDHLIVMNVFSRDNYSWGLHTTQASYVIIQDSVFTGSEDEHGAYISGGGDHFLIRRNVFQGNNASGLQVNADPQTATAEVFYYLQNTTGNTCGITEAQVEFTGSATWHQVKACYDQQGLPDLGEFIDDGISKNLIIERNVMNDNGTAGGAAINLASVRQSVVRNNVVYGNRAGSIMCWDNNYANDKNLASSEFGCRNVDIFNNTVFEQAGSRTSVGFMYDAHNMTVYNNVIARGRADAYEIGDRSGNGLRSGSNYYYALSVIDGAGIVTIDTDAGSGSVTGFNMTQAAANFVSANSNDWMDLSGAWPVLNPNRPDFHVLPGSQLAQMTANLNYLPETDFDGNTRTGMTVGAYDINGGTQPTPTATATSLAVGSTELLVDGGFEINTAAPLGQPDLWNFNNPTQDRLKCDTPTLKFAFRGMCAYRFKGGLLERAKLGQLATLITFSPQDTLKLQVQYKTNIVTPRLKLKLRVFYNNVVPPGGKVNSVINVASPNSYTLWEIEPYVLTDSNVTRIKVQFFNRATSGKIYVDDVSLIHTAAPAR